MTEPISSNHPSGLDRRNPWPVLLAGRSRVIRRRRIARFGIRATAVAGSLAALLIGLVAQPDLAAAKRTWYKVPLAHLLHRQSSHPPTHTTTIGGTLFRYAWKADVGDQGILFPSARMLKRNKTSCKSIALSAGAKRTGDSAGHPQLEYYREGMGEIRQTVPVNSVTKFSSVSLPTGQAILIKAYNRGFSNGAEVYVNGYAYCYTKNGDA